MGLSADALGILRDIGGDMVRGGAGIDWHNQWTLPNGVLAASTARRSPTSTRSGVSRHSRRHPGPGDAAGPAGELRWPLVKPTAGAQHVIEPIVQVIYSQTCPRPQDIPNEDSRLPEFDETNLFSLNRFPGLDRLETGLRANLGISYTRYDPAGWSLGMTLGQVLRSGIAGGLRRRHRACRQIVGLCRRRLARLRLGPAAHQPRAVRSRPGLPPQRVRPRLRRRPRQPARRLRLSRRRRLEPDPRPAAGDQRGRAQRPLPGASQLAGARPLALRRLGPQHLRAAAGITYGNECAEFDLSVSRRYTSSDNVPPSTSIGFSLRLAGIGENGERKWPERVCIARGT